jgi:hypothetical protein
VVVIGDPRKAANATLATDFYQPCSTNVNVGRDMGSVADTDSGLTLKREVGLKPDVVMNDNSVPDLDDIRSDNSRRKIDTRARSELTKPQAMPRCSQQPRCPNPVPPQERSATAFSGVTKGFHESAHNAF